MVISIFFCCLNPVGNDQSLLVVMVGGSSMVAVVSAVFVVVPKTSWNDNGKITIIPNYFMNS